VACYQGDWDVARSLCEQGLQLYREYGGDKSGTARALSTLGRVAHAQGDEASARTCHEESLALWRELGEHRYVAGCLEAFAGVAGAEGCAERAARLFGAAERLREVTGAPLLPADRAERERSVAAVRTALGQEAFAAAWAEGRAMALERAIAYALAE
jgi:hypothetical protein